MAEQLGQASAAEAAIATVFAETKTRRVSEKDFEVLRESFSIEPDLTLKALKASKFEVARTIFGSADFLTDAEQNSTKFSDKDKMVLAARRFGERYGDRLKMFQESKSYAQVQLDAFKKDIFQKISWGGLNPTDQVIAAVDALELPQDERKRLLAQHLVDRALYRLAYQGSRYTPGTKEKDILLVREAIGSDEELQKLVSERLVQEAEEIKLEPSHKRPKDANDVEAARVVSDFGLIGDFKSSVIDAFKDLQKPVR